MHLWGKVPQRARRLIEVSLLILKSLSAVLRLRRWLRGTSGMYGGNVKSPAPFRKSGLEEITDAAAAGLRGGGCPRPGEYPDNINAEQF